MRKLTSEWMFFSVVISWETPDIAGIWIAVGIIFNSFSIQRAHGAVEVHCVF